MRDKREITLPFDKAEKLLDSPNQLIKISGDDGIWFGETLNKSEIISTRRDYQKENDDIRLLNNSMLLEGQEETYKNHGFLRL